jgi:hypothetical protein
MRMTIEHENLTVSAEDPQAQTLGQALELVESALLGIGYHLDRGTLQCEISRSEGEPMICSSSDC